MSSDEPTPEPAVDDTDRTPERFSLTAVKRTRDALDRLMASTGMGRTDIVNRSVQLYAFVSEQLDKGHELAIHRPVEGQDRGEVQIVHVA